MTTKIAVNDVCCVNCPLGVSASPRGSQCRNGSPSRRRFG